MICQGCEAQMEKGFAYVKGEGRTPAKFLIVGEAPGATEDREGRPFVGETGTTLRRALRELGITDFYLTNSVRVRPGEGNPDPRMTWIRQCREVCMAKTIAEVQPELIVCVGKSALKLFTDQGNIPLVRNRHKTFWYKKDWWPEAIPVVATWHPSYINRDPNAYNWWITDLEAYMLDSTWNREILNSSYREVEGLSVAAQQQREFTIDVETTGLEPWNNNTLRCTGVRPSGSTTNIALSDGGYADLRAISLSPDNMVKGHGLMFDLMWGLEDQEIPACSVKDSLYLHYLLDERYPIRGLKHLARLYTPYEPVDLPKGGLDYDLETVIPYCSDDVALTDLVIHGIEQELTATGIAYQKCTSLYGRVIPILAGMVRTGIPVDKDVLNEAREQEEARVAKALDHIGKIWENTRPLAFQECPICEGTGTYNKSGDEGEDPCTVCSNEGYWWVEVEWDPSVLNRPHHLSDFIYKTLGLGIPKMKGAKRKDKRGSTARPILEAVLEEEDDKSGFIEALFNYRDVHENLNKYVLDVQNRIALDGRVRPRFNIVTRSDHGGPEGARTGRLSVSKPGLHSTPTGHPMRRAFVPLPGHTHLVQIDRSQAELTDLAQITMDPNLLELINEQGDQHQRMADMATSAGYPMSRSEAKTVNFGILYGIGPSGLEQQTRFDRQAGARFIDLWFEEYPQVKRYRREIHYLALKRGYVETAYGRRRNFPLGLDPRSKDGSKAQRQAFNFIIQATANDLNMLFLKEWCDHGLHDLGFPIFVIHDAVLFSTNDPLECMYEFEVAYKSYYAEAVEEFLGEDLQVVMRADAKIGPNWGELVGEDDHGKKLYWFSTDPDEGYIDNEKVLLL